MGASPFPKEVTPDSNRKIRSGIELKDFRTDRTDGKILPKNGERNVLITSALPYVNNQPHLGNIIGSTLSADVYARYSRQRNDRVLYICGTDEYGTTTEVMAAKEGVGAQELCDKYHKLHAEAYEWFEIGFDHFGRTSTPKQTEICQDIFLKLYQNGHFEEKENSQLYCEKDNRFLADRYVEGTCPACKADGARGDQCDACSATYDSPLELINPKCSACGSTPTERLTAHLLIKLEQLQPTIQTWVDKASANGTWSSNGKAFTDAWLKGGLRSRGMTRDLEWGVKLPKELGTKWEKKVMYVWFDAPIGYPSITANYTDNWKEWWLNPDNVTLYQFMGKDNVPFHTVLFPAYLMGTNDPWTMLNSISTTEYLQYEGTKFSKSKNVGVFGQNARDTGVPASVWRYYLLANRPETGDSEFTWDDFVAKSNTELLNNFGNFVNRMLKFVNSKYASILPDPTPVGSTTPDWNSPYAFQDVDLAFTQDINALLASFIEQMDHQKIRSALATVMLISGRGNAFIQENHVDNALLASNPSRCAEVILITLNLIYLLSAIVHPFMPSTSDSILSQLNATPRSIPDIFSIDLFPGHKIGTAAHLFTPIKPDRIEEWRNMYGGEKKIVDPTKATEKKSALELSKEKKANDKKALKERQAAKDAVTLPKTEEQIVLDEKIKVQGEVVRKIKVASKQEGGVPGSDEEKEEVAKLLALKAELTAITKSLEALAV